MEIKKEKFVGEELLCPIKYFLEVAGGKWKTGVRGIWFKKGMQLFVKSVSL